jgi:hypothetical protein
MSLIGPVLICHTGCVCLARHILQELLSCRLLAWLHLSLCARKERPATKRYLKKIKMKSLHVTRPLYVILSNTNSISFMK